MDQLPDPRNQVSPILGQQAVQKSRTGARQPGDHNRPLDRLCKNFRRQHLLFAQPQQVRQKPDRVPAQREIAEQAQIGLFATGAQENPQRRLKRGVAEILQAHAAPRPGNQLVDADRPAKKGHGAGHPVSRGKNTCRDRRRLH